MVNDLRVHIRKTVKVFLFCRIFGWKYSPSQLIDSFSNNWVAPSKFSIKKSWCLSVLSQEILRYSNWFETENRFGRGTFIILVPQSLRYWHPCLKAFPINLAGTCLPLRLIFCHMDWSSLNDFHLKQTWDAEALSYNSRWVNIRKMISSGKSPIFRRWWSVTNCWSDSLFRNFATRKIFRRNVYTKTNQRNLLRMKTSQTEISHLWLKILKIYIFLHTQGIHTFYYNTQILIWWDNVSYLH